MNIILTFIYLSMCMHSLLPTSLCLFKHLGQEWWCMPLISAVRRQKQENLYEFKASLVYIPRPKTPRATEKDPVSKSLGQKTGTWLSDSVPRFLTLN